MVHGEIGTPVDGPPHDGVVAAWRNLGPGRAGTVRVDVVRKSHDDMRAIYRLHRVGPGGTPVIGKRCPKAIGWIERTVYERILPQVPVSAPRCFGYAEGDGDFDWLFLEDVGQERFSPRSEAHRVLAARWLGTVHTAAARVGAGAGLPDRGPAHYLGLLRSARRTIQRHLADSRPGDGDAAILNGIARRCDALDEGWALVERCCEDVPATLVHGDFRRKNVYVRADRHGAALYPIDWETSGWGVPAPDLAPSRKKYAGLHVDLVTYASVVRQHWPGLDLPALQRLVQIGLLFRRLAGIHWATTNLGSSGTEVGIGLLDGYQEELSEIMSAPPWQP